MSMVVGTIIKIIQDSDSTQFSEFRTTGAPVDAGSAVTFATVLTDESNAGPNTNQASTITATIPVAASVGYVEEVGGLPTPPLWASSVVGFVEYDGVDQGVPVGNSYGIDISVQRYTASPDWGVVAPISNSGGAGSAAIASLDILINNIPTAPPDPTGLQIELLSNKIWTARWDSAGIGIEFEVEIDVGGGGFVASTTTRGGSEVYSKNPPQSAQFRLRAVNLAGVPSAWVNSAVV